MLIPKFIPDEPVRVKPDSRRGKPRTAKAPATRERDIERYLVKRVKDLGGEVRKVQWIGRRGAPDRIVMLPAAYETIETHDVKHLVRHDRTVWVELKAPGKTAEAHQLREHERMREMGQRVEVVDSFARVDEVLS